MRACVPVGLALIVGLIGVGCGSGTPTEVCATGTYDDDGDSATACVSWTVCGAGEYVSTAGTADADRECSPCAAGEYATTTNAASCTAWTACVAGQSVDSAGSATTNRTCAACADGTYSTTENQSTCQPHGACVAGTVQTAAGTATSAPVCMTCDAGEYCAGGTTVAVVCSGDTWDHDGNPATACATRTNCVAGQYVTDDGSAMMDRTCATCADGSFSTTTNVTMCTDWQVCSAGDVEGVPGSDTMDRTCVLDEWTRQFGTAGDDYARSLGLGDDGSVLVAGATEGTLLGQSSAGGRDAFVRKYDAGGAEVWTRQFGTASLDGAVSVSVGSDGSVLVAGETEGTLLGQTSAGGRDAFVRKYDAGGAEVWTRQFGTAGNDSTWSVSVGSDGSVLVAGHTQGTLPGQASAGGYDAFVRKYDAAGAEVWTRQLGTAGLDSANSVSVGSDGSVLVAGGTSGTLPGQTSPGDYDAFVRRYDAAGTEVWTRQFGSTGFDVATRASAGSDGSVLVAGYTDWALPGRASAGGRDAFVRSYDAAGVEVWTRQLGTAGDDSASSVGAGSDGSVLVVGFTSGTFPGQTSAGGRDAFVMRLAAP